jgi:hypothetical protein
VQDCLLWSRLVFRALATAAVIVLTARGTTSCRSIEPDASLRGWILERADTLTRPLQSLRVRPLLFAHVRNALPGIRAHRKQDTVRIDSESGETSIFASFFHETPSLSLGDDDPPESDDSEVNDVLFRIVRSGPTGERRGTVLSGFDPTKVFASGVCQAFVGEESRIRDSLATGWRCSTQSERLVIEISPSCAAATGRNGCVLVQMAAQWDDAVIE